MAPVTLPACAAQCVALPRAALRRAAAVPAGRALAAPAARPLRVVRSRTVRTQRATSPLQRVLRRHSAPQRRRCPHLAHMLFRRVALCPHARATQAAPPCVAALDSALGNAIGTGPRTLVTGGPGSGHAGDDPQWQRKTKVVCTIGPATCSREALFALADAGMNVARCVGATHRRLCGRGGGWVARRALRPPRALVAPSIAPPRRNGKRKPLPARARRGARAAHRSAPLHPNCSAARLTLALRLTRSFCAG
jgi:hypothetical protein